jgi:hypothetical protein
VLSSRVRSRPQHFTCACRSRYSGARRAAGTIDFPHALTGLPAVGVGVVAGRRVIRIRRRSGCEACDGDDYRQRRYGAARVDPAADIRPAVSGVRRRSSGGSRDHLRRRRSSANRSPRDGAGGRRAAPAGRDTDIAAGTDNAMPGRVDAGASTPAARWLGGGVHAGRLRFELRAAPGTYVVPIQLRVSVL